MHTALLSLDTTHALALLLISFAAGIGISAVGPGGVLMTIGLFAFTLMFPSLVAGNAIVPPVDTGIVGHTVYWRSRQPGGRSARGVAMPFRSAGCGDKRGWKYKNYVVA